MKNTPTPPAAYHTRIAALAVVYTRENCLFDDSSPAAKQSGGMKG